MSSTLVIVEDHGLVRDALVRFLDAESDFSVVASSSTVADATAALRQHQPDLALIDIQLPDGDGLDLAAATCALSPGTKVVVLTTFDRPGYLRRALDAGARGFLLKDRPLDELVAALHKIVAGHRAIDPDLALDALDSGTSPRTQREMDVLQATERGLSIRQIARDLRLSDGTVRKLHVQLDRQDRCHEPQ
ncbi:MAG: response regulator [Sciscionella sp.]